MKRAVKHPDPTITNDSYISDLVEKGLSREDAVIIASKTAKPMGGASLDVNEKADDVNGKPEGHAKRTGQKKKRVIIDAAVDITENPIQSYDTGDMAFGAKCLVAAALPYRNPKPEHLQNGAWVRQNGNYTLWIQGGPDGVPYGAYPRVFVIWLTTEAVRTQSRRIETGGTFREFCRKVHIDTSMGARGSGRRFIEQASKLLSSRAAFVTGSFDERRIRTEFLQFSEDFEFFFDVSNPRQASVFESEIILTEKFFNEITTHSIPLDFRAVAALKQSPLELDIYQWLAYRMHSIKGRAMPTWQQLHAQFGANHKELRFFKRDFLKSLHSVKQVYQGVRVDPTENGLILLPSLTPVPKKD